MKIAIISPGSFSVPPVIGSSVEHDIQMVAEQMVAEDHEVTVYTRRCREYKRSSRHGKLYYKRIGFKRYEFYLRKVISHLKRNQPDVILVENRPSYIMKIREYFPHLPLVLNMHSTVFASPPYISYPEMIKVAKVCDALLTNSKYLKNYYVKKYPPFKDKAYGVHLGINSAPFEEASEREEKIAEIRRRFNLKEGEPTLLFVGRLMRAKGIHLLLNVMPRLIKKYPKLKLVIAGSPRYGRNISTPYVRLLKQKTSRLKKHIVFTNFVPPDKIPYIYQLADVVIIPSLWQEPFGRVNLEAMASTKAVVASNRGGIPEVIRDRENGFIVSVSLRRYRDELYEGISKLLESEELREEYGKRGLELAKNFTWSKTAGEYLQIFENLTNEFIQNERKIEEEATINRSDGD